MLLDIGPFGWSRELEPNAHALDHAQLSDIPRLNIAQKQEHLGEEFWFSGQDLPCENDTPRRARTLAVVHENMFSNTPKSFRSMMGQTPSAGLNSLRGDLSLSRSYFTSRNAQLEGCVRAV